jgi:hypothetical protein
MYVRTATKDVLTVAFGNVIDPINGCSGIPITASEFVRRVADLFRAKSLLDFAAKSKK